MSEELFFESISTYADESIYQKFNKKKFLAEKRFRSGDAVQIDMLEELDELEEGSDITIGINEIFPKFQESGISSESKENSESNDIYFIHHVENDEKSLLKTFYPDYYLFTKLKESLLEPSIEGFDFSIKKRSSKRLPNFQYQHYIRVNIKRTFMNKYLLEALNKILEEAGFNTFFMKFPQSLANNVKKDFNKVLMNMRLKEIFRAKYLYKNINKTNYEHNLKLVEQIEQRGNPQLNLILNRKFLCLFEEYINSEECRKTEINRIKKSEKKNDEYFEKYIYLGKNFVKFCFQ